jgi:hypothetical protein
MSVNRVNIASSASRVREKRPFNKPEDQSWQTEDEDSGDSSDEDIFADLSTTDDSSDADDLSSLTY